MTITAAHLAPSATIETAKVSRRLATYIVRRIIRSAHLKASDTFEGIDLCHAEFRGAIDLAQEIHAIDWDTRNALIDVNRELTQLHGAILRFLQRKVSERTGLRPDLTKGFQPTLERAKELAKRIDPTIIIA